MAFFFFGGLLCGNESVCGERDGSEREEEGGNGRGNGGVSSVEEKPKVRAAKFSWCCFGVVVQAAHVIWDLLLYIAETTFDNE